MPRPSQAAHILEAALQCFAEYGYEGTRIKHIAQAAGVSEGALYAHFPSKEVVAQTIFEHYMGLYVQDLQFAATQDLPAQERLQSMVHITLAHYRANPDATHFILSESGHSMDRLPQDYPFPIHIVAQVIRMGQEQQSIREGQPLLLAAIFLGTVLRPMIVDRSTHHREFDLRHDVQAEQIITWAAWAAIKRSGEENHDGEEAVLP